MVDISSIRSHNDTEKKLNPFKKMLNDVKNFMKKDEEVNKTPSFEGPKTEKKPDSNTPKFETREKKKAKRSMRERRANNNEQKLPTKFKKGW
jgi:N-acetylmuramoyl-L-alanine amidase CwlA